MWIAIACMCFISYNNTGNFFSTEGLQLGGALAITSFSWISIPKMSKSWHPEHQTSFPTIFLSFIKHLEPSLWKTTPDHFRLAVDPLAPLLPLLHVGVPNRATFRRWRIAIGSARKVELLPDAILRCFHSFRVWHSSGNSLQHKPKCSVLEEIRGDSS